MSEDSVAVAVGDGLAIVHKASGLVKNFSRPGAEIFSSAIATRDGMFLLAARNLYAVDREAALRWSVPLAQGQPILNEWSLCRTTFASSRQLLIAVCNDGGMYGVDTGGRKNVVWQNRMYSDGLFSVTPLPSVGSAALIDVAEPHAPRGIWAIEPSSGQRVAVLRSAPGDAVWALSSRGLLARATAGLTLLDECARSRWRAAPTQGIQVPVLVGLPDERIFIVERNAAGEWQLGALSLEDGRRLAGPTARGTPVAIGADGTLFAVTCNNLDFSTERTAAPPELVAYDEELQEKWRVPLPVPAVQGGYGCPRPGVALDVDGVMYLAADADGTYVLAVQTRSPGLAETPWPVRFGAHNGSSWLD